MAMHRATFLEMGAYDVGMNVWGGENVELPIRVCVCKVVYSNLSSV